MFIKKNGLFLGFTALFLSGCSDKVDITFNHGVGLAEEAEVEIAEALKGIAIIDSFEWKNQSSKSTNDKIQPTWYKVRVEMNADENNPQYSIQQVTDIIREQFTPKEKKVTLTVDILESNTTILELLSINTGDTFTTLLEWEKANTNAYYSEKSAFSYKMNRHFYCAVRVPLETKIPNLAYQYHNKPELQGIEIVRATQDDADNLTFEAINTKTLTGLPVDDEFFSINLQSSYGEPDQYSEVFLVFKHIGDSIYNKYDLYGEQKRPKEASKEACEELLMLSTNSNLLGAAGNFTAKDNVNTVRLVY